NVNSEEMTRQILRTDLSGLAPRIEVGDPGREIGWSDRFIPVLVRPVTTGVEGRDPGREVGRARDAVEVHIRQARELAPHDVACVAAPGRDEEVDQPVAADIADAQRIEPELLARDRIRDRADDRAVEPGEDL